MHPMEDSTRPGTSRGEVAPSRTAGPRRAANLRRTLSDLGVDPARLLPEQSPADPSNPPTLLRLPDVSHAAASRIAAAPAAMAAPAHCPTPHAPVSAPPPATPSTTETAASQPAATVAAPVAPAAPTIPDAVAASDVSAEESTTHADAPRPRPEPPADWQNVVIQWLAAGLAAVAIVVIFTKWRDRPGPQPSAVQESLRLQVNAASSHDEEPSLPPEPPPTREESVRIAGASRRNRQASPVSGETRRKVRAASTSTSGDDDHMSSGSTRDQLEPTGSYASGVDPTNGTPEPQETDQDSTTPPASAPSDDSLLENMSPDMDADYSHTYPRTNPATYLYIDPPAATEPRFQPRGASGMAARGAANWEARGVQ